jgi:DNA repair photolyase
MIFLHTVRLGSILWVTFGQIEGTAREGRGMSGRPDTIHGRGVAENPPNRFASLFYVRDQDWTEPDDPAPTTQCLRDTSRSIIARNDSPDVGFATSINPYKGCEHGCVYCYARPTHEYLGFSAGLDFESKILVKEDAPVLLRKELTSPRWKPQCIAMSGVTDPYQPLERRLQLTRGCLEVLVAFRNPVAIITKNYLVTRDHDLLGELARCEAAAVFISITTLDSALARIMEPRASRPQRRLAALATLAREGIPVGVMLAPVILGLNDHEIPAILAAAAQAGARFAGHGFLRLPYGVASLFEQWLTQHLPTRKEKILKRLREMHGGKLNDSRFGRRMRGEGLFAEQTKALFKLACRRTGLATKAPILSTAAFRRPAGSQLTLFDA